MMTNNLKDITAEEIEIRVQNISKNNNGCTLVPYMTGRYCQKMLDEMFGQFGWKRQHNIKNGNNYCTISIWDKENKQWVEKEDVGEESNISKKKGEATDAFKRACVMLGIGIELYTAPHIFIKLNPDEISTDNNGTKKLKIKFHVSEIEILRKRIIKLVIQDAFGTERFVFNTNKKDTPDEVIAQINKCTSVEELQSLWGKIKIKSEKVIHAKDIMKAKLLASENSNSEKQDNKENIIQIINQ